MLRRTGFKPRKEPMAGGSSLKRSGSLKPVSDKQKASNMAQRATYAGMAQQTEVHRCLACNTAYHLQHSHILTQGNHHHQRANPLNIVYLCGDLSNGCHTLWEHHKAAFALRFPLAYAEKVRRMWLIDPTATRFFLSKNPAPSAACPL
jgi:hypothetical protein